MIIAPIVLTPEEREYINGHIKSDQIPWYWRGGMVGGPLDSKSPWLVKEYIRLLGREPTNAPYFEHTLMHRSIDPNKDGTVNSPNYELFYTLFDRWMQAQGITYTRIYRASMNLVEHHAGDCTTPHTDHDFPHCNWLMYLNTLPNADTVLFDKDFNVTASSPAVEFNCCTFPGDIHAHRLPPPLQRRMVVVFTYF